MTWHSTLDIQGFKWEKPARDETNAKDLFKKKKFICERRHDRKYDISYRRCDPRSVSEWETRARPSTRLEFDSTHTRPAAYSSISHGTRVVGRVTSHFVSTDYFRYNSVCTEWTVRCNKMRLRARSSHDSRLSMISRARIASHNDWKLPALPRNWSWSISLSRSLTKEPNSTSA